MKVKVARTGRVVTLSAPQRMFANERSTVLEGYAGDVIGEKTGCEAFISQSAVSLLGRSAAGATSS